jgi:hypothetical protein
MGFPQLPCFGTWMGIFFPWNGDEGRSLAERGLEMGMRTKFYLLSRRDSVGFGSSPSTTSLSLSPSPICIYLSLLYLLFLHFFIIFYWLSLSSYTCIHRRREKDGRRGFKHDSVLEHFIKITWPFHIICV